MSNCEHIHFDFALLSQNLLIVVIGIRSANFATRDDFLESDFITKYIGISPRYFVI